MSFITKKFLPRRTFLRGMGATMALPLLEAMVPAATPLVKTVAQPVRRLGQAPEDGPQGDGTLLGRGDADRHHPEHPARPI